MTAPVNYHSKNLRWDYIRLSTCANSSLALPELWISTRQLWASRIKLWRKAQMPSCTMARLYRIWHTQLRDKYTTVITQPVTDVSLPLRCKWTGTDNRQ